MILSATVHRGREGKKKSNIYRAKCPFMRATSSDCLPVAFKILANFEPIFKKQERCLRYMIRDTIDYLQDYTRDREIMCGAQNYFSLTEMVS